MSQRLDQDFIKTVNEGLVPKVREAAWVSTFVPTKDDIDVQFALELGVSILFDKPIFAVTLPGEPVPEKLRLIADHICVADMHTPEGQATLKRELEAFVEEHFPEEDDDEPQP